MSFRADFKWGAATAAYQIEGAADVDGRKPSVWDMHCRREGAIWRKQSGAEACDHYHRFREDVAIMKEFGLNAYRFSVSWPRVLPDGKGAVNPMGLAFYDQLVDELLEAGIEPYLTLFHWDFPLELYYQGGWLNADSPKWFADYTQVIADKLGDRVSNWMTHNEPQCFVSIGHQSGIQAPGDKIPFRELVRIMHHVLVSHGLSTQVLRARCPKPIKVGIAPAVAAFAPATESPADIEAARIATWATSSKTAFGNSWWLDPIIHGTYPEDGKALFGADFDEGYERDLGTIKQQLDFIGINLYFGEVVRAGENGKPELVHPAVGNPQTAFRWNVVPQMLYWQPKLHWERYNIPILITENGMSGLDWVAQDGKVHDPYRIDFLSRYIGELRRAAADGVDVLGYLQWSLLDNFEWAEGYKERFGLVFVDYPTQKRTPKDSFYWYKKVIESNGADLSI